MRRKEILAKLAEIAKDDEEQKRIEKAADQLFPRLEELLPDYEMESEVENMAIAYGDANRRCGFVNGFNSAVLLLAGCESLLLDAGDTDDQSKGGSAED